MCDDVKYFSKSQIQSRKRKATSASGTLNNAHPGNSCDFSSFSGLFGTEKDAGKTRFST
jgi:hypothetical protein